MKAILHPLLTIAGYQIFSVYDGSVTFDAEKLFSLTDETNASTKPVEAQKISIPVHVFLLTGHNRKILIDTGAGENFGPTYQSELIQNLLLLDIKSEQITDIYLTHIHNDHTGGLTLNGHPIFENAVVHVHQNELAYWLNPQNREAARTDVLSPNKQSFINAQKALEPYQIANKIRTFNAASVFPEGFSLIEMFGHTPGHSLFRLSDDVNTLIFCADMVHNAELQFSTPELLDGFDIDTVKGLENRLHFYEKMSHEMHYLAGAHLPSPGIGQLKKVDTRYTFSAAK